MGTKRVLRGGSWNNNARNVRAATRNANDPSNRNNNVGFRLSRAQRWRRTATADPTLIPSVVHRFRRWAAAKIEWAPVC